MDFKLSRLDKECWLFILDDQLRQFLSRAALRCGLCCDVGGGSVFYNGSWGVWPLIGIEGYRA